MKTNKPELLKIAYVSKAHGIKGEIFVSPLNSNPDWPNPVKEIFIGDSTSKAFSVKKYSPHKKGMIFELDNCQSRQAAEKLKFQSVFLPKKLFKSKRGERIYLAELISFHVEILNQGDIGEIRAFQSNKHQDFLIVQHNKTSSETLIPFVSSYIKNIDFSKKKIVLNLPKDFLKTFTVSF